MRSFVQWRNHCGLSAKTVNDLLANLCTFFRWLVAQGLAQANPLEHVERIDTRGAKQCRRALSANEAARLLSVAPLERAMAYMVALHTGLRRKELNAMQWDFFALDAREPSVFIPAAVSKNRTDARLPMSPELSRALRAYRPRNFSPFACPFRHRVPRIETVRKDYLAAGIPLRDEQGRRADFHTLRVTFGTLLLASGVHPSVVQQLMRHSDIRLTTRLYTDASQLPLAAGIAKMPALTQRKWSEDDTQKDTQVEAANGRAASSAVASSHPNGILQSA
ncbi:MAG: tyrosine-type recombinase/integrase [Candidatus Didemnitutus sp.]|nr:tyrosine-type recombinase/integrase [Candidatus Didemnitutus sp.]